MKLFETPLKGKWILLSTLPWKQNELNARQDSEKHRDTRDVVVKVWVWLPLIFEFGRERFEAEDPRQHVTFKIATTTGAAKFLKKHSLET